jgi:UPF0271 protein
MTIDLNCDLGENVGPANDEAIMPWITSANIACGFHAGDPVTIEKTILLALQHKVSIGAHPGYPDPANFGRKEMQMSREELSASILYQVGALKCLTEACGGRLNHVKPHGALYNKASVNSETSAIIAFTVKKIDPSLVLFGLPGSEMSRVASEAGLMFASEAFADRAYNDDGTLLSRNISGAVIHDTKQVIDRAVRMIQDRVVETISGKIIPIQADTICIHGDNDMAPEFARSLSLEFRRRGIVISSFTKN